MSGFLDTPLTSVRYQTRRKPVAKSKYLYGIIGLFSIFSLILGVGLYMKAKPNNELRNEEPKIIKGVIYYIL